MRRAEGPDLSRYNITFNPANATGPIDFAIHKATQGKSYIDLEFENIWRGVKQIPVRGAYHYQNGDSWLAQADHFLTTTARHDYQLYALDLEEYGNTYSDTFFADAKRIIDRWRDLTDKKIVLYTNGSTYDQLYLSLLKLYGPAGAAWMNGVPLWIASPTTAGLPILPRYRAHKDWLIHQYAWKGNPTRWGTGGTAVDENVFTGDYNTFSAYFKLTETLPPPDGEPTMTKRIEGEALVSLHVRKGPSIDYDVIGSLRAGDKIEADNNQYQWLHIVKRNGDPLVGWASAGAKQQYIKWSEVPAPTPQPDPAPAPQPDGEPDWIEAHWSDGRVRKYVPE